MIVWWLGILFFVLLLFSFPNPHENPLFQDVDETDNYIQKHEHNNKRPQTNQLYFSFWNTIVAS